MSVYVTISALDAGHLTLPERLFVTDPDPEKRVTVPSLSFLIQHPTKSTKLVFDLGLKRDVGGYAPAQQAHISQRQPLILDPDCAASLRYGADGAVGGKVLLDPAKDIDVVILSHVHWDHVGTPEDFTSAVFAVGSGTLDLLKNGAGPLYPAEIFNDDEIPRSRTVEFPPVSGVNAEYSATEFTPKHTPAPADALKNLPMSADKWSWQPLGGFPNALDLFGDGSVYVIDSPGHLYGHVNLLARVGENRYVFLGGDCCHDPRILTGEKGIALYDDGRGGQRSVHVHTGVAMETLDQINQFVEDKQKDGGAQVEVVVAHDGTWREKNRHRFWPGTL
ncbi:hypothetical protein GQ53DRAFT_881643 [Thozetella sp. PMI_491]|nr:hypothetical protein GQ53DRAFT_881643 [Thozetella sp. PMI_491]